MLNRLLTLKSWLILAAVVVVAVLVLSWCSDRARIKEKLGLKSSAELLQHAIAWMHEAD